MKELFFKHLSQFFPKMQVEEEIADNQQGSESGIKFQLLIDPQAILSYVQTLFFEERLIEVQIDGGTRLFFATLWDHPPDLDKNEDQGETLLLDPNYEEGSYLKAMDHLILSPLDPVAGNIKVRNSNALVLRFYTGTTAVEMGTRFVRADTVNSGQVLVVDFPSVGRIIPNNRPFRAKIPENYNLLAEARKVGEGTLPLTCHIMDLSTMGLSLKHEQLTEVFSEGDTVEIALQEVEQDVRLVLTGTIRHFAKIRTKSGNSTICGIQFDLESRSLASEIEQLFAKVQRMFLRSLAERIKGQDIRLTLQ